MGVRRYSKNSDVARWEMRFDDLQNECRNVGEFSPTIGELRDHGIEQAKWRCRNVGWRDDGLPQCWHSSDPFPLSRYPRHVHVWDIRQRNTCGVCTRRRPFLELIAE